MSLHELNVGKAEMSGHSCPPACVRSHCMLILLENGMDRIVSFCEPLSKRIFYTPTATLSCYSQFLS